MLEGDGPGVSHVARQTRQVIDQDGAERGATTLPHVSEQALKVSAVDVGAALGGVLELGHDLVAALVREDAAPATLVLDGARVLPVGRVPGVDCELQAAAWSLANSNTVTAPSMRGDSFSSSRMSAASAAHVWMRLFDSLPGCDWVGRRHEAAGDVLGGSLCPHTLK